MRYTNLRLTYLLTMYVPGPGTGYRSVKLFDEQVPTNLEAPHFDEHFLILPDISCIVVYRLQFKTMKRPSSLGSDCQWRTVKLVSTKRSPAKNRKG